MDPWEYLGNNPEFNKIFNEAMATNTRSVMASVAKMYEDGFKSMATLVDVGGGMRSTLSIIVKEHSHIRGINLDLPHVIATAPPITGFGVTANLHILPTPPLKRSSWKSNLGPSSDIMWRFAVTPKLAGCGKRYNPVTRICRVEIMDSIEWILHLWADEECVKLLRRSYDAMLVKGKVLIVEAVVEGDKEGESMLRRLGLLYDISMMVYKTGGKERREEEFKGLFQCAGCKSHTIIKLPFLQLLIVLSKA
eukprot:PITA_21860